MHTTNTSPTKKTDSEKLGIVDVYRPENASWLHPTLLVYIPYYQEEPYEYAFLTDKAAHKFCRWLDDRTIRPFVDVEVLSFKEYLWQHMKFCVVNKIKKTKRNEFLGEWNEKHPIW